MLLNKFVQMLKGKKYDELLSPCLVDDDLPFLFKPNAASWTDFRNELAPLLNVGQTDIRIVGSGRFGYSLKPWNNLKLYNDNSDIDVAVVNENQFDELWLALLRASYPRKPSKPPEEWLLDRQADVYTGWFAPLEITSDHLRIDNKAYLTRAAPFLDFTDKWFDALKRVARHAPRRHRDIKGRLYRSWEHARLYHRQGLVLLHRSIG